MGLTNRLSDLNNRRLISFPIHILIKMTGISVHLTSSVQSVHFAQPIILHQRASIWVATSQQHPVK